MEIWDAYLEDGSFARRDLAHGLYYNYLCETDCDKDTIILQEGETINFQWMRQDEFMRFVETDKYVKANKERMQTFFKCQYSRHTLPLLKM